MTVSVSLNEAKQLILVTGSQVTYLLEGQPGIGKSAMFYELSKLLPQHKPIYVECNLLTDSGDLQIPKLSEDRMHFIPNDIFLPDNPNQPLLIMLDEIGKANRSVQNAILRLMYERKISDVALPEGSIVFATTNYSTDGLGDLLPPHMLNRIARLKVRNPSVDEWLAWALQHDVEPTLCAWVKEYPHCLASYLDESEKNNPYIFNPHRIQYAFVTPRSLEKASIILKCRDKLSEEAVLAALCGTIGESAARDLQAYIQMAEQLPKWENIIKDPDNTSVPDSSISQTMLALQAVQRVDKETIENWLKYFDRLHKEIQALFVSQAMAAGKATILVQCRRFTKYAVENSWLYYV